MNILVTGAAGFIGFHTIEKIAKSNINCNIVGVDNINDYYDVNLKYGRLRESGVIREEIKFSDTELHYTESKKNNNYRFVWLDIANRELLAKIFERENITHVIHLAAQAGVRYSIENPHAYVESNLVGFMNVLECARQSKVEHFLYASSSSVYGSNTNVPFSENDRTDNPVSLYAATKKSNEVIAHSYSHLYGLSTTGLRFFTVYGPWGRPDMAPMLFADAIYNNGIIKVFNNGDMERDFTYIDDIVEGVFLCVQMAGLANSRASIFNIGHSSPVKLMDFISTLEKKIGKQANKKFFPMQDGDVKRTWADVSNLSDITDYKPVTSIDDGVEKFALWYNDFFGDVGS